MEFVWKDLPKKLISATNLGGEIVRYSRADRCNTRYQKQGPCHLQVEHQSPRGAHIISLMGTVSATDQGSLQGGRAGVFVFVQCGCSEKIRSKVFDGYRGDTVTASNAR